MHYLFTTQSRLLTPLEKRKLLKTLWKKGENADNQHFLLFPTLSSAIRSNLDQSKILSFGKELSPIVSERSSYFSLLLSICRANAMPACRLMNSVPRTQMILPVMTIMMLTMCSMLCHSSNHTDALHGKLFFLIT